MDQADSSAPNSDPERREQPPADPARPAGQSAGRPAAQPPTHQPAAGPDRRSQPSFPSISLEHPVIVGYDGSASSRNALAYAAGVSERLDRPLLVMYVCTTGSYCEPLTGQVVGVTRDTETLERWLLAELDQVTGQTHADVHIRTRRGSPARELAAAASEFNADALVIGAPGSAWHRLAGSVPGWLARHACCPVIVVP